METIFVGGSFAQPLLSLLEENGYEVYPDKTPLGQRFYVVQPKGAHTLGVNVSKVVLPQ